ncbi:MAG: VOC family protein [Deltaproteobacteria bacterium]|nr:VOC family protein [Deltaproteobacteria bacterium]
MREPDRNAFSRMKLPRVSQIGILVPDIPEAVANYTKLLNIGCWYRSNTVKNEAVYRGKPVNINVDIVLAFQGGVEIELIEVKGKEENVYSDLLAKAGGGLHHLGFNVSGYDRKLARMKANGIEVLQAGVITTQGQAITRYAYLDTIKQCGIISELIATTLKGIPMPHGNLIMDIGCLTGDAERVNV